LKHARSEGTSVASCPTCGHSLEPSDAPSALATPTEALRAEVRGRVDEIAWEGWLSDLEVVGMQGGNVVVRVPDRHCGWVNARYGDLLAGTVSVLAGKPVPVLVVDSQWRAVADAE
jgi:hypothetical protein